jgi:tRNA 2-thiouridine synthesizing protein D
VNKLAVVVTTSPFSNLTATAINYVETALQQGITVVGVFFYQDGALHANKNVQIASDEYQSIKHWIRLHTEYNLPLNLCITAAEKRGITCEGDEDKSISEAFTVAGLGELVELSSSSDRLVQF